MTIWAILLFSFGVTPPPVQDPAPPSSVTQRITVRIRGSVAASLRRANAQHGPALAAQAARLLRWRGDLIRNVQPNDELTLLYEAGETPELLALLYNGPELNLRGYRFEDVDGVARFYDETGQLIEPVIVNGPAPGYVQITETVQRGRGKRRHHGLDFKAPTGTPVRLPFAGRVSRVNWSRRINGGCVEVIYNDGRLARFLHLEAVAPEMQPGAQAAAGTPVGTVGSTGRSSAPHLHYEVRNAEGKPLDPLTVHGQRVGQIPAERQGDFAHHRARLDRWLDGTADVFGNPT